MLFEDNIPYNIAKVLLIVIGTLGMMYSTTSFKYTIKQMVPLIILYLFYVAGSSTAIIVLFGYTCFMRVLLTISFPAIYLPYRLAETPFSKTIFNYATQILLSLYVSASITLLMSKIHGSEMTDFLMRFAAYCIIILLEYRFLRQPFLRIFAIIKTG